MSLGETAILHITSDYGYGARGAGGVIPPNAGACLSVIYRFVRFLRFHTDLDFEVELLEINPTA